MLPNEMRSIATAVRAWLAPRPVLRSNVVLLAPFNEEKSAMGTVLMETLGGGEFEEHTRVQHLSETGVLYNLPGFYTPAGGATRALLGLPALKGINSTKTMTPEMRITEKSVALLVLDITMTPILRGELKADVLHLKEVFGDRIVFAGVNHDKFRAWSPPAQRKREGIWHEILGAAAFYACETETREGIPAVLKAIRRIR